MGGWVKNYMHSRGGRWDVRGKLLVASGDQTLGSQELKEFVNSSGPALDELILDGTRSLFIQSYRGRHDWPRPISNAVVATLGTSSAQLKLSIIFSGD